ncbi:hypothetical protein ACS0TY_011164 [Phlomoides rotata]
MDHLKTHNITLVLDQPLVGQGMSDNPMNAIFIPSPIPVELSLIQVVGITPVGIVTSKLPPVKTSSMALLKGTL